MESIEAFEHSADDIQSIFLGPQTLVVPSTVRQLRLFYLMNVFSTFWKNTKYVSTANGNKVNTKIVGRQRLKPFTVTFG